VVLDVPAHVVRILATEQRHDQTEVRGTLVGQSHRLRVEVVGVTKLHRYLDQPLNDAKRGLDLALHLQDRLDRATCQGERTLQIICLVIAHCPSDITPSRKGNRVVQVTVPFRLELDHLSVVELDDPALDASTGLGGMLQHIPVHDVGDTDVGDLCNREEADQVLHHRERRRHALDLTLRQVAARDVLADVEQRQLVLFVTQHDREPRRRHLEGRREAVLQQLQDPLVPVDVAAQLLSQRGFLRRERLLRLEHERRHVRQQDRRHHRAVTLVHDANDLDPAQRVRLRVLTLADVEELRESSRRDLAIWAERDAAALACVFFGNP